ncbi:MAG: HEAT repeat domain-containing protein [Gemmataceae bacterium]
MRCTAIFTLLVASAAFARQDKEPTYDGKTGDVWLEILKNEASARKRAIAATALGELRGKLGALQKHEVDLARSLRVDSSAAVKAQCAMSLAALRADQLKTIDSELVEAVKAEKDSRVRKELAVLFGRFPEFAKRAVPGLAAALKDPDAGTRAAAADALAKLGADAKDSATDLLVLLNDADRPARQAGIFALGRISPDNPSFVSAALIKRFGEEKEADLRREIVVSVKLIGDKSEATVAALMKMLTDAEADVQAEAARSLGLLGSSAKPAADALFKLATESKDKGTRIDALRAFGSALGPAIKDRLKDLIRVMESDMDFEVRLVAVEEIGSIGMELKDDKETMAALRKRLSDPQVKVREAAAVAIRRIEKKPEPKPKDKQP